MNFSINIISNVQDAHRSLENELGGKKLLCSRYYFSYSAFVISQTQIDELRSLFLHIGLVLSAFSGPGLYVLSKAWPSEVEIIFFIGFNFFLFYYLYRKKEILQNSKKIKLPRLAVIMYAKHLAPLIALSDMTKFLIGLILIIFLGIYVLAQVFEKGFVFYGITLILGISWLVLITVNLVIVFFLKIKTSAKN